MSRKPQTTPMKEERPRLNAPSPRLPRTKREEKKPEEKKTPKVDFTLDFFI